MPGHCWQDLIQWQGIIIIVKAIKPPSSTFQPNQSVKVKIKIAGAIIFVSRVFAAAKVATGTATAVGKEHWDLFTRHIIDRIGIKIILHN